MLKEKSYINCMRFYSTSNPCPNRDNEYISTVRRVFHPSSPAPQIIIEKDIINLARVICERCESFELIEK